MPFPDSELKVVEDRLIALVKCIVAKARADAEFAEQLNELLLSDTLRTAVRSKGSKKNRQEVFDPVAYLNQHSAEALRQCLGDKPQSELVDIARKQRLAQSKSLKTMERDDLIAKLVAEAQRRLDRGGVWFGHGEAMRQSGQPSQPESEPESRTSNGTA